MGLISWIVLGLVAGTVAGIVTGDRRPSGCLPRLAVGVLGALIGGALARAAGDEGVNDVSLRSIGVSALGAIALLFVLQAVGGRRGR
jgi:uncharacterized membrane protein YeaQ/YmgE (transglycosylase-associated protein family)